VLIIDDILFFPVRSIFWLFREISSAVDQELTSRADDIMAELSELYMMLETRQITEDEFEEREKELLDRLDEIQQREMPVEEEGEE
jgi:hypothetical protein